MHTIPHRPLLAAAAALSLFSGDVSAGRFFDDAEKQALFTGSAGVSGGTQRDGWTYFPDATSAQPPAAGAPGQSGWYKPARQGTTQYWDDKNGNGAKEPDEVKDVSYRIYFRATVDERRVRSDWTQFVPAAALRDAMAAQPTARREAGLGPEEPLVVFGRRCYAAGPCLELVVSADLYVVVDTGRPPGFGTYGQSWLTGDRKTQGYAMTRFVRPEPVDEALRALYAGPCGQASAEAALAMLRKWTQLVAARQADGPGFKGFYHPDMSRYFPLLSELPGEWVLRASDGGWGRGFRLQPVGSGMNATMEFRVHTELYEQADEPLVRAKKHFAEETRGWETFDLSGADEAARKKSDSSAEWRFRRGNVVATITIYRPSGAKTNAKPVALARRLAEVVLAKMRGTPVPTLPPEAPPKHTIVAKQSGDPSSWLGYGGQVALQVLDADGDPVGYEAVTLFPADPELGRPGRTKVFTDTSGEKSVEYVFGKPGANRLRIETAGGHTTLEVKAGGFLFALEPAKDGSDGAVKIRVRAVDAAALKAMTGLPVRCYVDDGDLPARGRLEAPPQAVRTDETGEAVFVYHPPEQQNGVKQGTIRVSASVDETGVRYRFSGSARLAVNLAPKGKDTQ